MSNEREMAELREKIRKAQEAKKAAARLPPGAGLIDLDFGGGEKGESSQQAVREDVPTVNMTALPAATAMGTQGFGGLRREPSTYVDCLAFDETNESGFCSYNL